MHGSQLACIDPEVKRSKSCCYQMHCWSGYACW